MLVAAERCVSTLPHRRKVFILNWRHDREATMIAASRAGRCRAVHLDMS
jgi:hypothetical protein